MCPKIFLFIPFLKSKFDLPVAYSSIEAVEKLSIKDRIAANMSMISIGSLSYSLRNKHHGLGFINSLKLLPKSLVRESAASWSLRPC